MSPPQQLAKRSTALDEQAPKFVCDTIDRLIGKAGKPPKCKLRCLAQLSHYFQERSFDAFELEDLEFTLDYLKHHSPRLNLAQTQWIHFALGFYLGEVIRKNHPSFTWVCFDEVSASIPFLDPIQIKNISRKAPFVLFNRVTKRIVLAPLWSRIDHSRLLEMVKNHL